MNQSMNPKQIRAMWYGVCVAVLMLLLPPRKDGNDFLGYSPLFLPGGRVDTMLLLLQWFLVGVITLCAIITLHTQDSLPFNLSLHSILSSLSSAARKGFAFIGRTDAVLHAPLFSQKEEEPSSCLQRLFAWRGCGLFVLALLLCLAMYAGTKNAHQQTYGGRSVMSR